MALGKRRVRVKGVCANTRPGSEVNVQSQPVSIGLLQSPLYSKRSQISLCRQITRENPFVRDFELDKTEDQAPICELRIAYHSGTHSISGYV